MSTNEPLTGKALDREVDRLLADDYRDEPAIPAAGLAARLTTPERLDPGSGRRFGFGRRQRGDREPGQ